MCDLIQDNEINSACRQNLELVKEETRKTLIYWRSEDLKSGDMPKHFDPNRPTVYMVEGFRKLIQKETFNIDENDAIDFLHATVPIAYSEPDRVRVSSPRCIEKFLENLEQFEGSGLTMN